MQRCSPLHLRATILRPLRTIPASRCLHSLNRPSLPWGPQSSASPASTTSTSRPVPTTTSVCSTVSKTLPIKNIRLLRLSHSLSHYLSSPTSSLQPARYPSLQPLLNPLGQSCIRHASSKTRWTSRQSTDPFTRAAKVAGLKSRAAFKLLQINERYHLFRPGQTVVDLGYAPGSWSQVAVDLTRPGGRVLGVDLIPAQPPRGVSTIQGDFLSREVRDGVRAWLRDGERGRVNRAELVEKSEVRNTGVEGVEGIEGGEGGVRVSQQVLKDAEKSYVENEREGSARDGEDGSDTEGEDRNVDVVLSDMSAPWELIDGLYKRSVSNPYYRLMNTSGNAFRDHAGSMDLCRAALQFSYDTLKVEGHFVCKFYQGAEDKMLEKSLKALFHKVHREKPESSRSESKESYFIGLRRLAKADKEIVFAEP